MPEKEELKMRKGQRKALIITLIVLLPLTVSLFAVKGAGLPSLLLYSKTFLSAGFVFFSVIAVYIAKKPDRLSLFCMLALILCMLGDIFLDISDKIEGVGRTAGVLMFFLQHIMMCAGLLIYGRNSDRRKKLLISMPVTVVGVCLFVLLLVGVVGVALGVLAVPAGVYAAVLAWTAVIPFTIRGKNDTRMLVMGVAGILFFIADSLLICAFIENAPRALSASNLIPYYYAQYLIAFSTGLREKQD